MPECLDIAALVEFTSLDILSGLLQGDVVWDREGELGAPSLASGCNINTASRSLFHRVMVCFANTYYRQVH